MEAVVFKERTGVGSAVAHRRKTIKDYRLHSFDVQGKKIHLADR
jgi:hypothetical protein